MTAATPAVDSKVAPVHRFPAVIAGLLAALILLVIPLTTTIVLGAAPYEAIARIFPGMTVAVLSTIMRVLADAGALVSVGALVHVLFLRESTARKAFDLDGVFEMEVLRQSSRVWMLGAAGLMVFDPLDTTGVSLDQLFMPNVLDYVQSAASVPGALWVRFIGAAIVVVGAHVARQWTGLLIPLLASVWAVLAPIVVGHWLVGPNHDLGNDAAVIQAFGTYVLFGVLAVLAFRSWTGRELPEGTLRRTRGVALVAIPVIIATDAVITPFLIAGTGLFSSLSGWFIVARWVLLALIAGVVFALRGGGSASTTRAVLTASVVLVATWSAVSTAFARVPTPQYFVDTTVSEIFMGFNALAAPTIPVLFTAWRINLLLLVLAVAGMLAYAIGLRQLLKRGDKWPVGRTISWMLGWAVVIFVTSSGFGRYSPPHFGIHMILHMALNMLAPLLLVLGGFLTLMLRASKAGQNKQHNLHDWITWALEWRVLRTLYNPILVFAIFILSYYGLYFSNLFGWLVKFHWAHQAMNIHFLLIGYIYYGLVIGVDRTPRPLPHLGRLGLVMAAMPFHGFFGVILMGNNNIIAKEFYTFLDLPWMDLARAQFVGGGVAWAGGELPALIVVVALGIQWARQDAKEAKRIDRHLDSGRDQEFDEYNKMLERLSQRDAADKERMQ